MQEMLAEWDNDNDVYADSDEDSDDEDAVARKRALMSAAAEGSDDEEEGEEDDEEDSSEEEEEEGDVEGEGEEVNEEESEEEEEQSEEAEASDEESDEEEYEEELVEEEVSEEEEEEEEELVEEVVEEEVVEEEKPKGVAEDDASAGEKTIDDDEPIVDTLKKKPKKKKPKKKIKKITDADEDDNEEDKAMKALLAGWDADRGVEDKADEDDDEAADSDVDDDSEASEREVVLEDHVLDHIVLAAPDLEEAIKDFQKKSGIEPVIAGTIKGLGIKCARVSFNDSSYLEIIAPDPNSPGPIGELLKSKRLKELTPFHWAVRSARTEELKDEVAKFGYTPDHISMFGAKSDGTPKKWEMLYLYKHKLGGICPFFINWANSDHPCAKLPVVGKLKKFSIRAPEDDPVHQLLDHVGTEKINIEEGKPKISFQFSSPEGTVKFSTSKAVGFKFPGFDDDVAADDDDIDLDNDIEFENPSAPELLPVGGDYDDI